MSFVLLKDKTNDPYHCYMQLGFPCVFNTLPFLNTFFSFGCSNLDVLCMSLYLRASISLCSGASILLFAIAALQYSQVKKLFEVGVSYICKVILPSSCHFPCSWTSLIMQLYMVLPLHVFTRHLQCAHTEIKGWREGSSFQGGWITLEPCTGYLHPPD